MRLYAYIHEHTRAVRIVTRSRAKNMPGGMANNLVLELTEEQYRDIFKVVPMRSNLKDAMRFAVSREMHKNPLRGKGHQSFVWSRGNWKYEATLDTAKEKDEQPSP